MQPVFQRYAHIAVFVVCELIAFILIVNFNQGQREIFFHSSSLLSGSILQKTGQLKDYMSLQDSNNDLLADNARLLQEIINMPRPDYPLPDSTVLPYEVFTANIINNSISSMRNIITIDRGKNDQIQATQGVLTMEGIVGITKQVGTKYSSVVSLLNVNSRVSASIEGEDFFGTVSWTGGSYDELTLSGIPIHATIEIGQQVVTNGYSTIFPKGLRIGQVTSFERSKDGAFYTIKLKPAVDFTQIHYVYIIKDNIAAELSSLQNNE